METIKDLLEDEKWIVANSVVLGDGKMFLLEVKRIGNDTKIRVLVESDIKSYLRFNKDYFSFIDTLKVIQTDDYIIHAGEGSYGSDGFIYVMNKRNKNLLWFAFFDCSNPFIEIKVDNENVIGISNINERWAFPISSPANIVVSKME